MNVRHATRDDLPEIFRIFNAEVASGVNVFRLDPVAPDAYDAWYDASPRDRYPVLAIESDGRLLGWASLSPYHDYGGYAATVTVQIWIDPAAQGRGAGGRLYGALLDEARRLGYRVAIARVESGNDASRRLQDRFGFRHVGTLREAGEKFGRRLDVEIYELRL